MVYVNDIGVAYRKLGLKYKMGLSSCYDPLDSAPATTK
jgi:hypothetical protein